MAGSAAHQWGQIIGKVLQDALSPSLNDVAVKHGLYLDSQGPRPARKNAKKVTWKDAEGNKHDLDYVLERAGTAASVGEPAAFIETAWRRYTKHSKAKAQEIEGSLVPIRETYARFRPFLGCLLAGEFTAASLAQLRSRDIVVVHVPTRSVLVAFQKVDIDAGADEETPEETFAANVAKWGLLSAQRKQAVQDELVKLGRVQIDELTSSLDHALVRVVDAVLVEVLHGVPVECPSVAEAVDYVRDYEGEQPSPATASRYEVKIQYSNADVVSGVFHSKEDALAFLARFL